MTAQPDPSPYVTENGWLTGPYWEAAGEPSPFEQTSAFFYIARGDDDPKRLSRKERQELLADHATAWRKAAKKDPVESWAQRIVELFEADPTPRTFNHIVLDLTDRQYTADIMFKENADEALWQLVSAETLAHTRQVPCHFALVEEEEVKKELQPGPTGLVSAADVPLTRICGQRDQAVEMMTEAVDLLKRGFARAIEARDVGSEASGGRVFLPRDHRNESAYADLFRSMNTEASLECFRKSVDASVWDSLLDITGMRKLMDAKALKEFYEQLAGDVPPVTEDNVRATLEALGGDARLIFLRGLARAFSNLDKRFRSHDAFKIGSRMIFTRVFNEQGRWNYYSEAVDAIADVERVFAVLDGQTPQPGELKAAVSASRGDSHKPRQGYVETRYFRVRTFKNGNAHLWFVRDDLLQRANECLAEFYGQVLPDAVPGTAPPEVTTALVKDLAFFATPEPVCKALLRDLYFEDAKILEPSAGTGNILRAIWSRALEQKGDADKQAQWKPKAKPFVMPAINAVEVHPGRAAQLRETCRLGRISVTEANFLQVHPAPRHDLVLMNPPFAGTHWMSHVMHAFKFLAPGGLLKAILPVTAELGDSKKHQAFRAWAEKHGRKYGRLWEELPPESFASSGTRVSTVILTLKREAE